MRFKGLDLNLLVVLDALLHEKSVSLAASRLHRSQSTISGSLAKLRFHFKDELLIPVSNKMMLTAFGESMAGEVRELLARIELTVDAGASFDPANSNRHFVLSTYDFIIDRALPSIVAAISASAPGVTLEFISASLDPEHLIESGQVDIVIVGEDLSSKAFHFEFIDSSDYVVVGWNENATLEKGTISLEDLVKLRRVAGRFGPRQTYSAAETQIQTILGKGGIDLTLPSTVSIPNFLPGTQRVALIHRVLAEQLCLSMPLTFCPLPVAISPFQLGIQSHPARSTDSGLHWLKSVMQDVFTERRSNR